MLNLLRRLFSVFAGLLSRLATLVPTRGGATPSVPSLPPATGGPTTPPPEHPTTPAEGPGGTPAASPDRQGTFIITDIYPRDLDDPRTPHLDVPPFENLVGLRFGPTRKLEMVGAIVKASQSTGWGRSNEEWFKKCWRRIREVGGDRYGVDWFRGCYHFLICSVDGARQADYYLRLVEEAGGWGEGDIMPIVDLEEGGQGSWTGGQKLAEITDPAKRRKLREQAIATTTKFAERVRSVTGHRVMLYGRGLMRDLDINDRMGCDAVMNPAWTQKIVPMDRYGWPIDDVALWQLCGDGSVAAPGFPPEIPGWGREDYSVYIDGARKTDLVSLRRRVLARSR